MSSANKCDRCGKFYDEKIEYPVLKIRGEIHEVRTIGALFGELDLCQSCWDEFRKWWERK